MDKTKEEKRTIKEDLDRVTKEKSKLKKKMLSKIGDKDTKIKHLDEEVNKINSDYKKLESSLE